MSLNYGRHWNYDEHNSVRRLTADEAATLRTRPENKDLGYYLKAPSLKERPPNRKMDDRVYLTDYLNEAPIVREHNEMLFRNFKPDLRSDATEGTEEAQGGDLESGINKVADTAQKVGGIAKTGMDIFKAISSIL